MTMKPIIVTSLREIQREEIPPTNQISTTEIVNHEIHRVRHKEVTPRHLGRIPTGPTETLVSPGKAYREAQIIHTLHRTINRGYTSMEQVFFRDLLPRKQACIQMHRDMRKTVKLAYGNNEQFIYIKTAKLFSGCPKLTKPHSFP
jgi:hypothetical protein